MRYKFLSGVFLTVFLFCAAAIAETSQKEGTPAFKAGETYTELSNKAKVDNQDKIEIISFFWYGCGGCFGVEPFISEWESKLPDDVSLVRIPAVFNSTWEFHGRIFYALESMNEGLDQSIHSSIFDSFQNKRIKIREREELQAFMADLGIDSEAFMNAFDSKEVEAKITLARNLMDEFELEKVPAMVINGKYLFDLGRVEGPEQYLALADFLINKERK